MSVSKSNELIGASPDGFEAAARAVVERAHRTLRGVTGVLVIAKELRVAEHGEYEYRVRLRLTFDIAPETVLHW